MGEVEEWKTNYNKLSEEFATYKAEISGKLNSLTKDNKKYRALYENMKAEKNDAHTEPPTARIDPDKISADVFGRLNSFEEKLRLMQQGFNNLTHNFNSVTEEIHAERNDDAQHNRKIQLLFHGVKNLPVPDQSNRIKSNIEFDEFMVKIINSILPNLQKNISLHDISTSHILPTKSKKKNVVLVAFTKLRTRNMVFFNKSSLKNDETNPDKISISEHLTKFSLTLIKSAKEILNTEDVWSSKGIIYAKHNGDKQKIRKLSDIYSLKGQPPYQNRLPASPYAAMYQGTYNNPGNLNNSFEYAPQSQMYSNFNPNYEAEWPYAPSQLGQVQSKRMNRYYSN